MSVVEYQARYAPNTLFGTSANVLDEWQQEIYKKRVVETAIHCSLDQIESYEIVQCGHVWVLLGKLYGTYRAICGGWSEIAIAIDKNELEIWKDLNIT